MNADVHALIGPYAVDALTEAEAARFEQHLAACRHCQAELAALQVAAGELGLTTQVTPPAALRVGVLAQVDSVGRRPPIVLTSGPGTTDRSPEPTPPGLTRHHFLGNAARRWIAAAVAATALAVGGLIWHPWAGRSRTPVSAVQQVLQAPDAERYVQHVGPMTATLVRSRRQHKSVLVVSKVAPAPTGHAYELWYLTRSGKAISAGLAPVSTGSGKVMVALNGNAVTAAGVDVTVEPDGGSPQQTTTPIMTFRFKS